MATDNQKNLLNALQKLLEKQTELTRKGNFSGSRAEELRKQADVLVRKIAQTGIINSPELKKLKDKLQKSYEQLCLALKAQKQATAEELGRIRKGKKTIHTYRNNI